MNHNWLANVFEWSNDVVEAAESPSARLAAFILPVLAPIVPAFLTAIRLHSLFLDLIGSRLPGWVALSGAVVTAFVLEILGWVGTIALVRFIYRWIKDKREEYLVPTMMVGIAYLFYIADMYFINVQLNSINPNGNVVIGLLSFFTIPAGLIFAVNLVSGEEGKTDNQLRQEQRADKLERFRIKHGTSGTTYGSNTKVPNLFQKPNGNSNKGSRSNNGSSKLGRPSVHQERVFSYLEEQLQLTGEVPTFSEVSSNLELPQSTVSRLRNEWINTKQ